MDPASQGYRRPGLIIGRPVTSPPSAALGRVLWVCVSRGESLRSARQRNRLGERRRFVLLLVIRAGMHE